MKNKYLNLVRSCLFATSLTIGSLISSPGFAVPNFQLNILGSSYDLTDKSIFINNENIKNSTDLDIDKIASFSHNAYAQKEIPESGTVLALGLLALSSLFFIKKRIA